MKLYLTLLFVVFGTSLNIRKNHDAWYTIMRKTAETGVEGTDAGWDYCDLKCLYMENLKPGYDFFVVNFKAQWYVPNLSVCYAQTEGEKPKLWKEVIQNSWYEEYCSKQDEDYLQNKKYEKLSDEGVGMGTPILY